MIISKQFEQPNNKNFSITSQGINATIVDSGLRIGVNKWDILFSSELISGDVVSFTLNGVSISETYTTSFANTISLLQTAIEAVDGVDTTVYTDVFLKTNAATYTKKLQIVSVDNTQLVIENFKIENTSVQKFITLVNESLPLQILPAILTVDFNNVEALRVDSAAGTTYTGYALPGSLSANPVWRIKRTVVAGAITTITYASGNSNFDKVWDDRATYTYS